jgi:multiple antibiotic resistance protein
MVFPEVHGPLAEPYVAGPSTLATVLLLTSRKPGRRMDWLLAISTAWCASAVILLGSAKLTC